MTLLYGPIWTTVITDNSSSHDILENGLVYEDPSARHSWLYKCNRWDGKVRLYDRANYRFRSGLYKRAATLLGEPTNIPLEKIDPTVNVSYTGVIKPFQFQLDTLKYVDSNDRGLIVAKTGSGKTLIVSLIISHLKIRTIVMVTDIVLLDQMRSALSEYLNVEIGMIGDSIFDPKDITVSTYQSFNSILNKKSVHKHRHDLEEYIDTVQMVISDEAHLFDSNSAAKIMPLFTSAVRFYGVSATPYGWDSDSELTENLELEQHFGQIIYDMRNIDMSGLRTDLVVQYITLEPLNKRYINHKKKFRGKYVLDHSKNYREALETEILNNKSYHEMVASIASAYARHGKSVFVHATHSIQFGEAISNLIPGSYLVNGSTPRAERSRIYNLIQNKEALVLVSDIGGTGLNIPSLDVIILASDVKDVRQLIGRVVRKFPGKDHGMVVDIHIPTTFLGKHRKIRESQYKSEGAVIFSL